MLRYLRPILSVVFIISFFLGFYTILTTRANAEDKITICHATGSEKNPFVKITISIKGLNGHINHPEDIIPASLGDCDEVFPPSPD